MNDQQLDRTLRSIGREVFVTYFKEFCDRSRSNEGIAAQIEEERGYTAKSCRSRTSHARNIIGAGRAMDALIMVSRSTSPLVPRHIKEKAANWFVSWSRTCYEQAIVAEEAIDEAVDNSAPCHSNGFRAAEWVAQPVHLMAPAPRRNPLAGQRAEFCHRSFYVTAIRQTKKGINMVEYSYCGSDGVVRSAVISECGLYRYRLDRVWDTGKAQVLFVMLNPSTADATVDDRTIGRCMEFACAWGYGGLVVGNLFAYRATDPQQLKNVDDPVGPENDHTLSLLRDSLNLTICAWGNRGSYLRRDDAVYALLTAGGSPPIHCLGMTKGGHPKHPLYLLATTQPIAMNLN